MEKFKDKYRIQSARLQTWNYNRSASYFITICTAHREHYFGKIENDEMVLSEIGEIARQEWIKTPEIRPDMNLKLDEFIVIPNHFHAIVFIGKNEYNSRDGGVSRGNARGVARGDARRDAMHGVSTNTPPDTNTPRNTNTPPETIPPPSFAKTKTVNQFGPQYKNLGSVMRGYKSAVTTYTTTHHIDFGWQSRFHDHIIRNNDELFRIRQYIRNNPFNWKSDKFFENP